MTLRLLTAFGVLLPVLMGRWAAGLSTPWWMTFLAALVAFGTGRIAQPLLQSGRGAASRALGTLLVVAAIGGSCVYAITLERPGSSPDEPTARAPEEEPQRAFRRETHPGTWVDVSVAREHTCAVTGTGAVACWHLPNMPPALGIHTATSPEELTFLHDVAEVRTGDGTACARTTDGSVSCWGWNWNGAAGVPPTDTHDLRREPVRVPISRVARLSVFNHSCAIDEDGAVWCWGSHQYGALGAGGRLGPIGPTKVAGLPPASEIGTAYDATCALTREGELWCWGVAALSANRVPEHFDGHPVRMEGLPRMAHLGVGYSSACALDTTGHAWCWGTFPFDSPRPRRRLDVDGATEIAVGRTHACVVLRGGRVRCFGKNYQGQLGTPTVDESVSSYLVPGVSGARHVDVDEHQSCAITASALECWGRKLPFSGTNFE